MSARSQLQRTFLKYRTTYITLMEEVTREGELEALKKREYAPLQVLYCYWDETTGSESTNGGEAQFYTAKIRVLKSDLGDNLQKVTQYCRVIQRVIVSEWHEDEMWTIETIFPKYGPCGFDVLELSVKLPKEGNRVRL